MHADAADRQRITEGLLAVLAKHRVPAVGFVIWSSVRDDADRALLDRWLAAGHEIGNHSDRHLNLTTTAADTWLADVERAREGLDGFLRERKGRPLRFFRFPFLREGDTDAKVDAVRAWLARTGQRNLTVTIDDQDWSYEEPWVKAAGRRGRPRARRGRLSRGPAAVGPPPRADGRPAPRPTRAAGPPPPRQRRRCRQLGPPLLVARGDRPPLRERGRGPGRSRLRRPAAASPRHTASRCGNGSRRSGVTLPHARECGSCSPSSPRHGAAATSRRSAPPTPRTLPTSRPRASPGAGRRCWSGTASATPAAPRWARSRSTWSRCARRGARRCRCSATRCRAACTPCPSSDGGR